MSGLSISDSKTLWVGDIENWMNEDYLNRLFSKTGATVLNVKIIKDKVSGSPLGYGFVEFNSHEMAAKVLQLLNQSINPATNKPFRLNWGVYGGGAHVVHNKPGSGNTGAPTTQQSAPAPQPAPQASNNNMSAKGGHYTQIYVGNLDLTINENHLLDHFKKRYNTVSGAKIIVEPVNKISKGYGFVQFSDPQEASRAIIEMQGT